MLLQTLQDAYAIAVAQLAGPVGPMKLIRGYRTLFANKPEKIDEVVNNTTQFYELAASGAGYSKWYLWKENNMYFIVSCDYRETISSFNFTEVFEVNGRFIEIEI